MATRNGGQAPHHVHEWGDKDPKRPYWHEIMDRFGCVARIVKAHRCAGCPAIYIERNAAATYKYAA